MKLGFKIVKVTISSSNPGSFENSSEGSNVEDAKRHMFSRRFYDPSVHMEGFSLDLRF